jgi:hypothetical protein
MRSSSARCRLQPKQAANFRFELSRAQKSAAGFPAALFILTDGCGRSRLKFSRLSFPADKATSRSSGGSSVSSTSLRERPPAAYPSASRCRGTIRRTTTPPSGNTSPTTEIHGTEKLTGHWKHNSPGLIILDRNELGEFVYGCANKQTTRRSRLIAVSVGLLSSCLTAASSRSVRIPVYRDVRLR